MEIQKLQCACCQYSLRKESMVNAAGLEPATHALKGSPNQLQTTTCTSSLLHARRKKIKEIQRRHRSGCPEGAWNAPPIKGEFHVPSCDVDLCVVLQEVFRHLGRAPCPNPKLHGGRGRIGSSRPLS